MRVRTELKSGGEDERQNHRQRFHSQRRGCRGFARAEDERRLRRRRHHRLREINLAVAVAVDDGLVTPVIRAAQNQSLPDISPAVKDLAHRARTKKIKPEEYRGGTLTVSNLGSYGIDYFSAIINPPQAIIFPLARSLGSRSWTRPERSFRLPDENRHEL